MSGFLHSVSPHKIGGLGGRAVERAIAAWENQNGGWVVDESGHECPGDVFVLPITGVHCRSISTGILDVLTRIKLMRDMHTVRMHDRIQERVFTKFSSLNTNISFKIWDFIKKKPSGNLSLL